MIIRKDYLATNNTNQIMNNNKWVSWIITPKTFKNRKSVISNKLRIVDVNNYNKPNQVTIYRTQKTMM